MPDVYKQLGLGTAGISSMKTYGAVMRLLNTALEKGITHFDTAPLYGQGYAEKMLGDFIRGKRDKVTITTKVGLGSPGSMAVPAFLALPLNYYRKALKKSSAPAIAPAATSVSVAQPSLLQRSISLEQVKQGFYGSLQRLRVDYIDYYFLHEALPGFLEAAAQDFLLTQKEKGRIKYLGVATGSSNILPLTVEELQHWDVLQYEAGPGAQQLSTKFPGKKHFLHSCLKNLTNTSLPAEIAKDAAGGYQLATCAANYHHDKLLFATRRIQVLKQNLDSFSRYMQQ